MVWKKPDFKSELNEFKRVAKEKDINLKDLKKAYDSAELVFLEKNFWKKIENTDSWETTTREKAEAVAKKHNRNIDRIYNNIHGEMDAPIVLINGNDPPTLVSGNTRLMVCRVMGIQPDIVLIKI